MVPAKLALVPSFVVDFLAFHSVDHEAPIEVVLDGIDQFDFYTFWLDKQLNKRWLIVSFARAKHWLRQAQFNAGYPHHHPLLESETYQGKRTIYRLQGKFVRVHKEKTA